MGPNKPRKKAFNQRGRRKLIGRRNYKTKGGKKRSKAELDFIEKRNERLLARAAAKKAAAQEEEEEEEEAMDIDEEPTVEDKSKDEDFQDDETETEAEEDEPALITPPEQ